MINLINRVHFIGIGGIGVSALAKLMLSRGKTVSGSDINQSEITDELQKMGAKIFIGHSAKNVAHDTDLIIYSDAVPNHNPERGRGRETNIKELSYFEFLGKYSGETQTIAVSGTNGKSTTTAMLGQILEAAGRDPTVIVGSKVEAFSKGNLRPGRSDCLVVEACEHNANMLRFRPRGIVLTNIEADHLDFYKNLENIKSAFRKYIGSLPDGGFLVVNNDDKISNEIKAGRSNSSKMLSYGIENPADLMAQNIEVRNRRQYFDLIYKSQRANRASLRIPGRFNILNALAAAGGALMLGVDLDCICHTLEKFSGIWRRFEQIGERGGAAIISDYGHHQRAIAETLQAAREFYLGRRIVLAFQPHHYNRTINLFNDFVGAFDGADLLILSEIFDVAGRERSRDKGISSNDLVRSIKARDRERKREREVFYGKDTEETLGLILRNIKPNDLIIVMGAGDIYKLAYRLSTSKY